MAYGNGSEHSMDMVNDLRLTTPTILDKRLHAFTSQVGVVGGLTTSASLSQCFKLKKHLVFGYCSTTPAHVIVKSAFQLVSFFLMAVVLCLSLYSTLVSVNQAYFGNRLMTAGTNGFELARGFYMHPSMVLMRHRSVRFLARALILLLVSAGGMLYVKFCDDQDEELGELDLPSARLVANATNAGAPGLCKSHVHPMGVLTMLFFCSMALYLHYWVLRPHESLFKELYTMRYADDNSRPLLANGQDITTTQEKDGSTQCTLM